MIVFFEFSLPGFCLILKKQASNNEEARLFVQIIDLSSISFQ